MAIARHKLKLAAAAAVMSNYRLAATERDASEDSLADAFNLRGQMGDELYKITSLPTL